MGTRVSEPETRTPKAEWLEGENAKDLGEISNTKNGSIEWESGNSQSSEKVKGWNAQFEKSQAPLQSLSVMAALPQEGDTLRFGF